MEPITLTLLTLGGLFAAKAVSKPAIHSVIDPGFKFDCKSIKITNEVKFENFLKRIIKEAIRLPKFSNPSTINFCDFLEYCYNNIIKILNQRIKNKDDKLKCSVETLNERIVILFLKGQISNVYIDVIFNLDDVKAVWTKNNDSSSTYDGIMINGELYTREEFNSNIRRPCLDKLQFGLDKNSIKKGLFYYTKKYPNLDYEPVEISGFELLCTSNHTEKFTNAGYIVIKDHDKFEAYLRNLVNKIANQPQFQDPYKLNLENFINEYLKRLNSYCSNCFYEGTLTSRMTLIIYVLIQYGLNFYIDGKFGIEDSPIRENYFENYFYPAFEKLNPKFDYIDDWEVEQTEKHMKENEETNGWI